MTHLKIIQAADISNIETVSAQILLKLYEVTSESTLDNTSDLRGHLHVSLGNRTVVEWIRAHFPNLTIDVDNYAIVFEDPNMLAYLQNTMGIGSTSGVITETEAAAATSVANSTNTSITKFNELKYFTNVTESRGGFNVNGSGDISFAGWTALQEIDISNFTSIGHKNNWNMSDRFHRCTALKKVTASSRLTALGASAFENCENLEDIIGLSGTITLCDNAFYACKKLKSSNFSNCSIFFDGENLVRLFRECSALTTVPLSSSNTVIPLECFYTCTALQSMVIPEEVTTIGIEAFRTCTSLSSVTLPSTLTTIERGAFLLCASLTSIDLSSVTTIDTNAFDGCTSLSGELNIPALTTLNGYGQYFRNCNSLTKVKCLGKINTINAGMFQRTSGTSALQEVYLPYECTTIKNDSFADCTNLATIKQYNKSIDQYANDEQPVFNFISRITSFGQLCFKNCSSLTLTANDVINAVTIGYGAFGNSGLSGDLSFPHLETIGVYPFLRCPITSVDLTGSTVTTIGSGFINGSPCDHIILPSTLTKIDGSDNFLSTVLRWVKCPCTTPPTLNNNGCFRSMPNTTKIYVPDASLSTYQSAEIWSSISTQIKPLSDFSTDFPNG